MINLNLKEFYSAIDRASTIMLGKDKNIIKMQIDNKKISQHFSSFASNTSIHFSLKILTPLISKFK